MTELGKALDILLVEDEPDQAALIKRAFRNANPPVGIRLGRSLAEARALLAEHQPDLMITDLLLPDGKGTDLLTAELDERQFPAIVMTSYGNEQVAVEALKRGATDYIVKSAITLREMNLAAGRALREWDHIVERRRAEQQLRESEHQLRESLAEKEVLLREVYHRVKNNMQVVMSLLSLEAVNATGKDPTEILHDCESRVRAMAVIHERLYQSESLAQISLDELAETLLSDLHRSFNLEQEHLTFRVEAHSDVQLTLEKAVPCALLLNELISNSFKHAFPDDRPGEVWVEVYGDDDGGVRMIVRDNGVGLPDGVDPTGGGSMGSRLIRALARQLRASLKMRNDGGAVYEVHFHLEDKSKEHLWND